MRDVCFRITGENEFSYQYVDNAYEDPFLNHGYNMGRMAVMHYQDTVSFISFSEKEINGRNSSVQSAPTAFALYYMNPYPKKRLYYYFLNATGNADTDYQKLMYRLMKTIGFTFLNASDKLGYDIVPFSSIEDIMYLRQLNTQRNRSNNASYITSNGTNQYDIYGKTYGANKYATSMMCYAVSMLAKPCHVLKLYEVTEGDLEELPRSSIDIIRKMRNIEVIPTDLEFEKRLFNESNGLRSPRYTLHLLEKRGPKWCALCGCEIPEIIEGAHIWPVASIKNARHLTLDEKIYNAVDGENGLWLCENHHKLFDEGLLTIGADGAVRYQEDCAKRHRQYLDQLTTIKQLPESYLTPAFRKYVALRNGAAI